MNDEATATVLAVAVLAAGAIVGVGATGSTVGDAATGPAADAASVDAQETRTQANDTRTDAEADGEQRPTNVTARNVTVERLVLRNATVLDARLGNLTVVNATGGANASDETYRNVAVQRIEVSGEAADLTLTNVTIRNESLAAALTNESGQRDIDIRLLMNLAVLKNQTVNGLVVESATVQGDAVENVSVSTDEGNQTAEGERSQRQPAMSAETADVGEIDLTSFEVSGVSMGETVQTATATASDRTTTAAPANETT